MKKMSATLPKGENKIKIDRQAAITVPAVYVHIPFCEKKCFYCSFAVAVGQRRRIDEYLSALSREADRYACGAFDTLYIGGGTPSFMDASQIGALLAMLRKRFDLNNCRELTVEANPEGLDLAKAKLLKDLGVTRISLGVQSLQDRRLKSLGRCHDGRTAVDAFRTLRKAGFRNINIDLMFSYPDQTDEDLQDDVRAVCSLGSEHLSLYALTIEPNSRFFTKKIQLAGDNRRAAQYELIVGLLKQHGFRQYEVSNFAKPGYESRHNTNYWSGGNYIGLGMSAHSHIDGRRFWNVSRFADYLFRVSGGLDPKEGEEVLTPPQRLTEALLFGLRMNAGVNVARLETRFGCRLASEKKAMIEDFIEAMLLSREGDTLRATMTGRLVLDELSAKLI